MSKKEIDSYIAGQSEPEKTLLKEMRKIIMEIEPSLKQGISYGIPAFKLDGEVICGIAGIYLDLPHIPQHLLLIVTQDHGKRGGGMQP